MSLRRFYSEPKCLLDVGAPLADEDIRMGDPEPSGSGRPAGGSTRSFAPASTKTANVSLHSSRNPSPRPADSGDAVLTIKKSEMNMVIDAAVTTRLRELSLQERPQLSAAAQEELRRQKEEISSTATQMTARMDALEARMDVVDTNIRQIDANVQHVERTFSTALDRNNALISGLRTFLEGQQQMQPQLQLTLPSQARFGSSGPSSAGRSSSSQPSPLSGLALGLPGSTSSPAPQMAPLRGSPVDEFLAIIAKPIEPNQDTSQPFSSPFTPVFPMPGIPQLGQDLRAGSAVPPTPRLSISQPPPSVHASPAATKAPLAAAEGSPAAPADTSSANPGPAPPEVSSADQQPPPIATLTPSSRSGSPMSPGTSQDPAQPADKDMDAENERGDDELADDTEMVSTFFYFTLFTTHSITSTG